MHVLSIFRAGLEKERTVADETGVDTTVVAPPRGDDAPLDAGPAGGDPPRPRSTVPAAFPAPAVRPPDRAPTSPPAPPTTRPPRQAPLAPLPVSLDPLPPAAPPPAGALAAPAPPPFAGLPTPRRCALPALGWQTRQSRSVADRAAPNPSAPPVPGGDQVALDPGAIPAVTIDAVTIEPVTIETVTIEPVTIEPVTIEPVTSEPVTGPRPAWPAVVLGRAARWASYAVLGAAAWILILTTLPRLAGWQPTVITGHSMEPTIDRGDVIVVRPAPASAFVPGAVITFDDPNRPGRLITHRVVAVRADGRLTTRGDHNHDADPAPVAVAAVHGRAVLRVPFAGRPVMWAIDRRWLPLALTAAAVVAAVRTAFGTDRRPGRRRRRLADPPGQLAP